MGIGTGIAIIMTGTAATSGRPDTAIKARIAVSCRHFLGTLVCQQCKQIRQKNCRTCLVWISRSTNSTIAYHKRSQVLHMLHMSFPIGALVRVKACYWPCHSTLKSPSSSALGREPTFVTIRFRLRPRGTRRE